MSLLEIRTALDEMPAPSACPSPSTKWALVDILVFAFAALTMASLNAVTHLFGSRQGGPAG